MARRRPTRQSPVGFTHKTSDTLVTGDREFSDCQSWSPLPGASVYIPRLGLDECVHQLMVLEKI